MLASFVVQSGVKSRNPIAPPRRKKASSTFTIPSSSDVLSTSQCPGFLVPDDWTRRIEKIDTRGMAAVVVKADSELPPLVPPRRQSYATKSPVQSVTCQNEDVDSNGSNIEQTGKNVLERTWSSSGSSTEAELENVVHTIASTPAGNLTQSESECPRDGGIWEYGVVAETENNTLNEINYFDETKRSNNGAKNNCWIRDPFIRPESATKWRDILFDECKSPDLINDTDDESFDKERSHASLVASENTLNVTENCADKMNRLLLTSSDDDGIGSTTIRGGVKVTGSHDDKVDDDLTAPLNVVTSRASDVSSSSLFTTSSPAASSVEPDEKSDFSDDVMADSELIEIGDSPSLRRHHQKCAREADNIDGYSSPCLRDDQDSLLSLDCSAPVSIDTPYEHPVVKISPNDVTADSDRMLTSSRWKRSQQLGAAWSQGDLMTYCGDLLAWQQQYRQERLQRRQKQRSMEGQEQETANDRQNEIQSTPDDSNVVTHDNDTSSLNEPTGSNYDQSSDDEAASSCSPIVAHNKSRDTSINDDTAQNDKSKCDVIAYLRVSSGSALVDSGSSLVDEERNNKPADVQLNLENNSDTNNIFGKNEEQFIKAPVGLFFDATPNHSIVDFSSLTSIEDPVFTQNSQHDDDHSNFRFAINSSQSSPAKLTDDESPKTQQTKQLEPTTSFPVSASLDVCRPPLCDREVTTKDPNNNESKPPVALNSLLSCYRIELLDDKLVNDVRKRQTTPKQSPNDDARSTPSSVMSSSVPDRLSSQCVTGKSPFTPLDRRDPPDGASSNFSNSVRMMRETGSSSVERHENATPSSGSRMLEDFTKATFGDVLTDSKSNYPAHKDDVILDPQSSGRHLHLKPEVSKRVIEDGAILSRSRSETRLNLVDSTVNKTNRDSSFDRLCAGRYSLRLRQQLSPSPLNKLKGLRLSSKNTEGNASIAATPSSTSGTSSTASSATFRSHTKPPVDLPLIVSVVSSAMARQSSSSSVRLSTALLPKPFQTSDKQHPPAIVDSVPPVSSLRLLVTSLPNSSTVVRSNSEVDHRVDVDDAQSSLADDIDSSKSADSSICSEQERPPFISELTASPTLVSWKSGRNDAQATVTDIHDDKRKNPAINDSVETPPPSSDRSQKRPDVSTHQIEKGKQESEIMRCAIDERFCDESCPGVPARNHDGNCMPPPARSSANASVAATTAAPTNDRQSPLPVWTPRPFKSNTTVRLSSFQGVGMTEARLSERSVLASEELSSSATTTTTAAAAAAAVDNRSTVAASNSKPLVELPTRHPESTLPLSFSKIKPIGGSNVGASAVQSESSSVFATARHTTGDVQARDTGVASQLQVDDPRSDEPVISLHSSSLAPVVGLSAIRALSNFWRREQTDRAPVLVGHAPDVETGNEVTNEVADDNTPTPPDKSGQQSYSGIVPSIQSDTKKGFPVSDDSDGVTLEVCTLKGSFGTGFCIEGGIDSPAGPGPILVKRIFRADSCLQRGDVILSVNGTSFADISHFDAWKYLKALPAGNVTFCIRRK